MPGNILLWPIPMQQSEACVFIFMGLIASGKSTLAQGFADRWHLPYFNSDIERKKLAQLERTARGTGKFAEGIYTPEFSRLTYDTLIEKGKAAIQDGSSVVLDGSYAKQSERQKVREAFVGSAKLFFILCEVSEQVTRERLQLRALDENAVSDGTYEIYVIQKQHFEYPNELDSTGFLVLETDGDAEQLLTTIESSLNIPPFSV
jgi:predicted kinase